MLRTMMALAAGTVALGASAQGPNTLDSRAEREIARKLEGRVPGQPVACITPSASVSNTRAGGTMLIESRYGKRYLTRFLNGCSARAWDAMIDVRPTNRICRGEIVSFRDPVTGIDSGSCVYGDFIPYEKAR